MKIYISGKIGEQALSEATVLKFGRVQAALEREGHEVINPASPAWQAWLRVKWTAYHSRTGGSPSYKFIMLKDIAALAGCDAICLLPDYAHSPGATAEAMFARACGIGIYRMDEHGNIESTAIDIETRTGRDDETKQTEETL